MLKPIVWDKPYYLIENSSFAPVVWEGSLADIPKNFNAIRIPLDGRMQADLKWEEARKEAQKAIELNKYIFWELDLGLFDGLNFSLSNQPQYLSLRLSLEHFRDSIWKEFAPHSLGLILFRGDADFSRSFVWEEQQSQNFAAWLLEHYGNKEPEHPIEQQLRKLFCRDVAVEYLTLLSSCLPDELPRYLLLDMESFSSPLDQVQQLHPDRYEQFSLGLKNAAFSLPSLGWENSPTSLGFIGMKEVVLPKDVKPHVGICLPTMEFLRPSHYFGIEIALDYLITNEIPFKVISETHLVTEWDGLDYLFYVPQGLSSQGKRKLQGFCAAGGIVITTQDKMGFAQETSLNEWISTEKEQTTKTT